MSPSRLGPAKGAHIVRALLLMSICTIGSRRSTGTPSATEHALAYTSRNTVPSSWSGLADDGG
eukprot:5108621-Prymnesium_polylepis.1